MHRNVATAELCQALKAYQLVWIRDLCSVCCQTSKAQLLRKQVSWIHTRDIFDQSSAIWADFKTCPSKHVCCLEGLHAIYIYYTVILIALHSDSRYDEVTRDFFTTCFVYPFVYKNFHCAVVVISYVGIRHTCLIWCWHHDGYVWSSRHLWTKLPPGMC